MAHVIVRGESPLRLEGEQAREFLQSRGIGYESWDVSVVPEELRTFRKLSPEEQQRLMATWEEDLKRLMRENGYQTADVVSLSEATVPQLETMLDRFRPEHYHSEDEVRFVVSGHGMFGICQGETVFEVHVGPGDLLKVPQGTWHWFDLEQDRCIQCVRLFQDTSGWTPYYRPSEMPTTA